MSIQWNEKDPIYVQIHQHLVGLVIDGAIREGDPLPSVRAIAEKVKRDQLVPETVSEQTLVDHLYTAGTPDPDLLIRTSGEMRVSNFMLWQISYAELVVTERFWPDFGEADLIAALEEFAGRDRRFGNV